MTEEEDPPAFKAARKKDKDRLQRLEDNGLLEHGLSVFFLSLGYDDDDDWSFLNQPWHLVI